MPKSVKPYSRSAAVYNHMMRQVNYKKWADYIVSITENRLPDNPAVLDASAGTGTLVTHLALRYPRITAADLAPRMVSGITATVEGKVCADMCNLPFAPSFHMVISSFDSVNYLLSRKKLLSFFRSAAQVLLPGGILCFDASLEKNSTGSLRHLNSGGNTGGIVYNRRSVFNAGTRIHTNTVTMTLPDGSLEIEVHRQKIYPLDVYFDLMDKAGFYVIECLEGFEYGTAHQGSPRAQFVAKRKP